MHGLGQRLQVGGGQQRAGAAHCAIGLNCKALAGLQQGVGGVAGYGDFAGARLHGHGTLQHCGCGPAFLAQGDAKAGAAHAGHSAGGAHFKAAQGILAGGDGGFDAAALDLQHRLHGACTAPAAQLAQLHVRLGVHPHDGAVGQSHGDKAIGAYFQLGAFGQGRAGWRCVVGLSLGRGGQRFDVAVHEFHAGRFRWLQAHRNPDHRARLQVLGVFDLVAGLQARPQLGGGQVTLGQPFEGVTGLNGVGDFVAPLGRKGHGRAKGTEHKARYQQGSRQALDGGTGVQKRLLGGGWRQGLLGNGGACGRGVDVAWATCPAHPTVVAVALRRL